MLIKTGERKKNEWHLQCPNLRVAISSTEVLKQQPFAEPGIGACITEKGNGPRTKVPVDRKERNKLCTEWVINSWIIKVNNGRDHIHTPFNKAVKVVW